ncbi:sugar ABC transporter substrate-binding protein [Subtercola sp. YIM 133946]|uniref:sugar ABC transporter substrate-binding protein n=1 Tax=Subtercola sp. YIM 133946 TaxID=3118909 RepID=UPI002F92D4E0
MKFPARRLGAAALGLVMMTALAACSSGTPGSSPGATSNSAASGAQAAAQADVAAFTADQPPVTVSALPSKPNAALTIAISTCALPVCHTTTDAAVEAAKALGWTVRQYESEMTPEAYVAVWDQIMQDPPDLIAYTPVVPDAAIANQLKAAAALKIPVVSIAPAGDRPDKNGPVYAAYASQPTFVQSGTLMGETVVADGGTGADTVFVWDSALSTIWDPLIQGFKNAISETGSQPDVLDAPTSGIGTDVPGQVVSYLQSHPNVKYVAFALGDYTAGVPEALAAAGLSDQVKIVSLSPQAANLANIKSGKEFASVAQENTAAGWRAIDGLARLSLGETPDDEWFEPAGWHQIFTKDNVTETTTVPTTPGTPDSFLSAWGVTK